MARAAQLAHAGLVTLVALVSLVHVPAVLAQVDNKPRPGSVVPPATPRTAGNTATGRARITMRVAVGEAAPDFELTRLNGKPLRLSKLRGEWASSPNSSRGARVGGPKSRGVIAVAHR